MAIAYIETGGDISQHCKIITDIPTGGGAGTTLGRARKHWLTTLGNGGIITLYYSDDLIGIGLHDLKINTPDDNKVERFVIIRRANVWCTLPTNTMFITQNLNKTHILSNRWNFHTRLRCNPILWPLTNKKCYYRIRIFKNNTLLFSACSLQIPNITYTNLLCFQNPTGSIINTDEIKANVQAGYFDFIPP